MRESCHLCAYKHLSAAYVILSELDNWIDHPTDPHLPLLIGHLVQAEEHLLRSEPRTAMAIREYRAAILGDRIDPAYTLGVVRTITCPIVSIIQDVVDSQPDVKSKD